VPVDQRVRQLPLRADQLNAVALDLRRRGTAAAQLLPLDDELGDPQNERLDRRTSSAAPERGAAQGSESWAASHAPSIGTMATEM